MYKGILKSKKAARSSFAAVIAPAMAFLLSAGASLAETAPVMLKTIRGGFHGAYAAIVFEFDGRAVVRMPVVGEREAAVAMEDVTTTVASYRGYRTFDSYVILEADGNGLNARIGLPRGFSGLKAIELTSPDRFVLHLYIDPKKE